MAQVLRQVERICSTVTSCSTLCAHKLQQFVVEAIVVVAGANYSIARYASNLQMQILSLRSLFTENQLLHCFMAQLELQQSRSLAQELQLPALIWAQLIHDTQELFPLGPGLKEEVEMEGGKEGTEVEGGCQGSCNGEGKG